jgi:hypothetical protein
MQMIGTGQRSLAHEPESLAWSKDPAWGGSPESHDTAIMPSRTMKASYPHRSVDPPLWAIGVAQHQKHSL